MKRMLTPIVLIALAGSLLLSSCTSEEFSPMSGYTVTTQTSEQYLASNDLPAILFSYNVYDPKTDLVSSLLIDTEGKIRLSKVESDILSEGTVLSPYYMDSKKEKSTMTESTVDLDILVDNFKNLRVANNLTYDQSAKSDGTQTLTAVYGYTYHTDQDRGSCDCASSHGTGLQLYQSVLLEQKIGEQIIQSNTEASATLAWLNNLRTEAE